MTQVPPPTVNPIINIATVENNTVVIPLAPPEIHSLPIGTVIEIAKSKFAAIKNC